MFVKSGELYDRQEAAAEANYIDPTPESERVSKAFQDAVKNGRKGGLATAKRKAPQDCAHCRMMGYTSWMQHIGHLGFAAMLLKSPQAAHIVRAKIKGYYLPELINPEPETPF